MAAHVGRPLRDAHLDQRRATHRNRQRRRKRLLFEFDALVDVKARRTGPIRLPCVADETLVEMEMTVDQAWQHETSAEIEYSPTEP